MTDEQQKYFLCGDIGGTKTALTVYSVEDGIYQPIEIETYPSHAYASLEDILKSYLARMKLTIEMACFGVAGPVLKERARVTNLPWILESQSVSLSVGGAPVSLLNDLLVIANAIPFLTE